MSGVVGIVSCFALSGCAHPTQSSVVDANGFSQTSYGVMALATGGQFVGADWRVDDWVAKGGNWEPKGGAEYETVRDLDLNGDGQIGSDEHLRERVSDLKLSNLRDGSVIWLKVHPMLPSAARMDLSSLLDKFGEGLAGAKPLAQASLFTSAPLPGASTRRSWWSESSRQWPGFPQSPATTRWPTLRGWRRIRSSV